MSRHAQTLLRAALVATALLSHGCTTTPHQPFLPTWAPPPALEPQGVRVTTAVDEREGAEAPTLLISGITRDNELQAQEMRIRVHGAPALDPAMSIGMVFDDKTRMSVQLATSWRLDVRDNALVVPAAEVAKLIAKLPARGAQVMLGLASRDGNFAFGVRFQIAAPPPQPEAESTDGNIAA